MKVEALIEFTDQEARKLRPVGEVFTVSQDRYGKLVMLGYVRKIEENKTKKEAAGV